MSKKSPENPANLIGVDYRDVPPRKVDGLIVDAHTHVRTLDDAPLFFEAAEAYGVWHVITMTPFENVPALHEAYPERLSFIAIPNFRKKDKGPEFLDEWLAELEHFRSVGAVLCKFWMAPPMRGEYGITLEHPFVQPIIERALELGYGFMTHVGDPSLWFDPGGRYADHKKFGDNAAQFDQLEFFLEKVAPRPVIGAHMGGNVEDLPYLADVLTRHPNYHLDSSATKWIVREVSRQPEAVGEFVARFQDRILFGSDLVTGDKYDFDHYASRYWTHRMLWETDRRGRSPIHDPDGEDPPQLNGVNLPADVLEKLYWRNAERLGLVGPGRVHAVA